MSESELQLLWSTGLSFYHFGDLARRFSYTCNINNMHKFVQEVASTQVIRYKKKNRNLYPWPGTVSKMVLHATGLGFRGSWPGTACLPRSHLSLKGILYLWSAMMKSLLYLPAWHSLLSALQSPSLSSHLIVELQQWYPVTGCS